MNARPSNGWIVTFVGGTIPFSVGLTLWFCTMYSIANPTEQWLNPAGATGFSYGDIRDYNEKLAGFISTGFTVGFTNLTATGIFICTTAWFGLRQGLKWSWFLLLFAAGWIGGNDSLTTVSEFMRRGWDPVLMVPLAPTSLVFIGLAMSWRTVFRPGVSVTASASGSA